MLRGLYVIYSKVIYWINFVFEFPSEGIKCCIIRVADIEQVNCQLCEDLEAVLPIRSLVSYKEIIVWLTCGRANTGSCPSVLLENMYGHKALL